MFSQSPSITPHGERPRADVALLERALAGDKSVYTDLVERWSPIIQARTARILTRRGYGAGSRARQELEDLVQEVFVSLFERGAKALRAWSARGGLSLDNWVGLLAERQVLSILRIGRRNPWREDTAPIEHLDRASPAAGPEVEAIDTDRLDRLLNSLQEDLTPLGWSLFLQLYVQERSVEEVCESFGMKSAAVYAWRSRLRRRAQKFAVSLAAGDRSQARGQPQAGSQETKVRGVDQGSREVDG